MWWQILLRRRLFSGIVLVIGLIGPDPQLLRAQSVVVPSAKADGRHALEGLWLLNRDKGPAIAREDERDRRPVGLRRGRSGVGRGAMDAASREALLAQRQATVNYLRLMAQPSTRLTFTVRDNTVVITQADGYTETLRTDNKWVDGRAENGLVKLRRRARWAGTTLVSEIELEQFQVITRTWSLANGGTELLLNMDVTGMSGGPSRLLEYIRPLD